MPFSSAAICWMLRSGMFGFWGITGKKIARSKASALRWNWRTRYQCYSVWNKDGFIEWIH